MWEARETSGGRGDESGERKRGASGEWREWRAQRRVGAEGENDTHGLAHQRMHIANELHM